MGFYHDGGNGGIAPHEWDALRRKAEARLQEQRLALDRVLEVFRSDEFSHEEKLRAYQEARAAGVLSGPVGFFLVVLEAEYLADEAIAETYEKDFAARFRDLEEEHGIDPDEVNIAHPDYRALSDEYNEMADRTLAATLRRIGENEIARLFEEDRDEFDRRREAGRAELFGPLPSDEELQEMMREIEGREA